MQEVGCDLLTIVLTIAIALDISEWVAGCLALPYMLDALAGFILLA